MNAQTPVKVPTGLDLLRQPFPAHQISKLPKETKAQAEARKNREQGCMVWKCPVCDGAHHKDAIHLDYVGHAALTDRLLDVDPEWNWEPVSFGPDGLPVLDRNGGLWVRLTVLGMSRLGYGDADGKTGGNAIKEAIGDALRNAAMRFGAALDLWHKGDLHLDADDGGAGAQAEAEVSPAAPAKRENWGGRYPNKTALWKASKLHHEELRRLGETATFDDLDGYLTSPEYQDYVAIANERFPWLLEGPAPADMPEYVPTFAVEQKARDLIAIRGNVPLELEGTD